MKARFLILVLIPLFSISITLAQEKLHCPTSACDFQPGDQAYAFGHNIKLRAEPNTTSKVLDKLKIGEWVKIIEKTPFSWPFNGFESPFYKVKYNGMTGYILGGLLSLEKETVNNQHYFFTYSKQGEKLFLNIRTILHGTYLEKKIPLKNGNLAIRSLGNKGLPNLDGILYINYLAKKPGDEDGGIYIFLNHFNLGEAIELSKISKEGVYVSSEKFIFPDDEEGIPDAIYYKKEQLADMDEIHGWLQSRIETRLLSWTDGKLSPNFRKNGFKP